MKTHDQSLSLQRGAIESQSNMIRVGQWSFCVFLGSWKWEEVKDREACICGEVKEQRSCNLTALRAGFPWLLTIVPCSWMLAAFRDNPGLLSKN